MLRCAGWLLNESMADLHDASRVPRAKKETARANRLFVWSSTGARINPPII
jgi:hypothetical protein